MMNGVKNNKKISYLFNILCSLQKIYSEKLYNICINYLVYFFLNYILSYTSFFFHLQRFPFHGSKQNYIIFFPKNIKNGLHREELILMYIVYHYHGKIIQEQELSVFIITYLLGEFGIKAKQQIFYHYKTKKISLAKIPDQNIFDRLHTYLLLLLFRCREEFQKLQHFLYSDLNKCIIYP